MLLRMSASVSRRVRYDRAQLIQEVQHRLFRSSYLKFRHSYHRIGVHTCTNQTVPSGTTSQRALVLRENKKACGGVPPQAKRIFQADVVKTVYISYGSKWLTVPSSSKLTTKRP
jgi:hypothetical protein